MHGSHIPNESWKWGGGFWTREISRFWPPLGGPMLDTLRRYEARPLPKFPAYMLHTTRQDEQPLKTRIPVLTNVCACGDPPLDPPLYSSPEDCKTTEKGAQEEVGCGKEMGKETGNKDAGKVVNRVSWFYSCRLTGAALLATKALASTATSSSSTTPPWCKYSDAGCHHIYVGVS